MSLRKIVMRGGCVGNGDRPQAGPMGGENPRLRVLQGEGLRTPEAQMIQDETIQIGFGFWRRSVLPTSDHFEAVEKAVPA